MIYTGEFDGNIGKRNEANANLIESVGSGNQVLIKNTNISNSYVDDDIPLILIRISNLE